LIPVYSLAIPWLALLAATEPDRLERLWWLWPLQVVFLSSTLLFLPSRLLIHRLGIWIIAISLLLQVGANPLLVSRLASWSRDGWFGKDAEEISVIDSIAHQVRLSGQHAASIGYDVNIKPFFASFHAADQRYKVGAIFDLILKSRHGIVNTNECAEGISEEDEYRLVELENSRDKVTRLDRIKVPFDARFTSLQTFASYRLLQRQ
jgi:hypothetical protein